MNPITFLVGKARVFLALCLVFLIFVSSVLADTDPKYYAVQASAKVQVTPPQISLTWPSDSNATGYTVSRKVPESSSWESLASLSGSATSFLDTGVAVGTAYEYQISKSTSVGYSGYGYLCAGINAPLIEGRGKVVLVVDNLYAQDLSAELAQLQQDLVGDGWVVIRHDVSRSGSPPAVKSLIQSDYTSDPANVRAVFLFGHVPVPYSGDLNPDGHPNHQGAWPADAYYGDMDGTWTDNSVSHTGAERQANWNTPGDGKFDQSQLPSAVELEVGRVDLATMTCYSNKTPSRDERDLLRQYLHKDHNFRYGLLNVQRRGLVCDNFGEKSGEAFAAGGWRNFSAFFGADNVSSVAGGQFFSALNSQSYLCSYGCGGGSYYTCDGLGSSDDFATGDVQTVFMLLLGSYFGDWDNESNFLRAPLGSTSSTLAVAWSGRPHWFLHHMGLGETIGYGARLSQNNSQSGTYSPQNYGTADVHIALLGDPTLRLHPVLPPSNLSASANAAGLTLQWAASLDSDIQGYHVYRAPSADGPFVRITGDVPISQTEFTDPAGSAGSAVYMVRAVKLEHSGSGTYFNPSQGILYGATASSSGTDQGGAPAVPVATPTITPDGGAVVGPTTVSLATSTSEATIHYTVDGSEPAPNSTTFVAPFTVTGSTVVKAKAFRVNMQASATAVASFSTSAAPGAPARAAFVGQDTTTQGNWKGVYGADGYLVVGEPGSSQALPAYAQIVPQGQAQYVWSDATSDPRALQKARATDRVAGCWYQPTAFDLDVNFTDGQTHRLTLYCLDWDAVGRSQQIDVLDASSGTVLNSQTLTAFSQGTYLGWDIQGHVTLHFTRLAGNNALVTGLFLSPTPVQLNSASSGRVSISSQLGTAPGQVQIRITGHSGDEFLVQASSDLVNWITVADLTLSGTFQDWVDRDPTGYAVRYYRAKPAGGSSSIQPSSISP